MKKTLSNYFHQYIEGKEKCKQFPSFMYLCLNNI